MTTTIVKNVRCKAFSAEGVRINRVMVELDDEGRVTLLVWDSVAGHYTTCHAIKPAQCGRIVSILRKNGSVAD